MRDPLPHPESFVSRLRGPQLTARIGLWLGIAFGVAFVTGLISHVAQQTPGWLTFPSRPVSLYRVTQAVHVTAGTVAVPLLLAKLWSVYPKLFVRPDLSRLRSMAVQGLERLSIGVLVAAAIFQLVSGLANSAQWYPWHFSFVATHYAIGWVAVGALLVHIAVKLPVIRSALGEPIETGENDRNGDDALTAPRPALTRRGLLRGVWVAAAAAALTTAGAAVPALRRVSVFAIRSGDGPQGIPINHSATEVRVVPAATDPAFRLQRGAWHAFAQAVARRSRGDGADQPRAPDRLRRGVERIRRVGRSAAARPAGDGRCPRRRRRRGDVDAGEVVPQGVDAAGELRSRPVDPARAHSRRRGAEHRPRLSVPPDRARPARCSADEVGRPDRGARMRAARLATGAGGLAALCYGIVLMSETGWRNIARTLPWLVGGVLAHDGLLAPVTIALVVIATRLLPPWLRGPAAIGLVVLGSLTLVAIPVLGRFGARADNPTLLDRDYWAGWLIVAAIVLVAVAAGALWRRRHDLQTADARDPVGDAGGRER